MNGILIVDKPSGITSHDVVQRIRRISGVRKVGHGGTLDPLATGVLPVLIGSATKLADSVIGGDKEYLATIKLGETTDTDDSSGTVIEKNELPADLEKRLNNILPAFVGKIDQAPPVYSAIKKNGRKMYKIARKGGKVALEPRKVEIFSLTLEKVSPPLLKIRVKCSKGTYIRALARDIGARLGCGGHIVELRRIASGGFRIDNALKLDEISTLQDILRVLVTPSPLKKDGVI